MDKKQIMTIPFNYQCFKESVKLRNMTINALCNHGKVNGKVFDRNEKTIRCWKKDGTIPPDILDRPGRFLDVDPVYISGEYDRRIYKTPDQEMQASLRAQLKPERFPYLI